MKKGDRVRLVSPPDWRIYKLCYAPPIGWEDVVKETTGNGKGVTLENWFGGYLSGTTEGLTYYDYRFEVIK